MSQTDHDAAVPEAENTDGSPSPPTDTNVREIPPPPAKRHEKRRLRGSFRMRNGRRVIISDSAYRRLGLRAGITRMCTSGAAGLNQCVRDFIGVVMKSAILLAESRKSKTITPRDLRAALARTRFSVYN